jgi:hypothetical protein
MNTYTSSTCADHTSISCDGCVANYEMSADGGTCALGFCKLCGTNVNHPDMDFASANICDGCREFIEDRIKCPDFVDFITCRDECSKFAFGECENECCVTCGVKNDCYTQHIECECNDPRAENAIDELAILMQTSYGDMPGHQARWYHQKVATLCKYIAWVQRHIAFTHVK